MKTLKLTTLFVLAVLISMSFASRMVKSKMGDLDILASRGGDKVLCTAHFNDELALIKEVEADALVLVHARPVAADVAVRHRAGRDVQAL